MAGKKNIEEVTEEVVVEEKATPKKPSVVPYMIPLTYGDREEDAVFVSVNGVNKRIKKGETVMLPVEFVEVIENSIKENTKAYRIEQQKHEEFIEGLRNVHAV